MNFYESFEIAVRIMFMTVAVMAVYYYLLYNRRKSIETRKKETINFFFQDKINYEKVIIDTRSKIHFDNEQNILEILGIFEKLAISIKTKVFDREVLLEYYGKYMIHFYREFKYFILKRREESGNPYLFIEYEKLVYKIESDLKFKTQDYYE